MSRALRIPDAERTATMFDLVRREYPGEGGMSLSHVVVQEVAPGTGFSAAQRWADLLALSAYGATVDESYCRMPRQCSQFAPRPCCEWISWPGTRRRKKCGAPMVGTVSMHGLTQAVCAKHAVRHDAERAKDEQPSVKV